MRLTEIRPIFCDIVPDWQDMEEGVIYISELHHSSIHLCACGCKQQTVLPFNSWKDCWTLVNNNGLISITPSIGNFSGEDPYHAHYFITENKIIWC